MTFKADWEPTQLPHLPQELIEGMLAMAFPHVSGVTLQPLSGGCANLNMRVELKGYNPPVVLRIYLRDPEAGHREAMLSALLKRKVPVPEVLFVGDWSGYQFAILQWVEGISLRDLLLGNQRYDMQDVMHQVGRIHASITSFSFPKSGVFDERLQVIDHRYTLDAFVDQCLQSEAVTTSLLPQQIHSIKNAFDGFQQYLPDSHHSRLVHGDFDPANILVKEVEGRWAISSILDWEFAFSGSPLWDVANMLRYAHTVDPLFKKSFLEGILQGGVVLPEGWRVTTLLLNIGALLDCLQRWDPQGAPRRVLGIQQLISHILRELESDPLTS